MKVSEIFYSLSGEGRNAGIPTVFVRLAGCNLRCDYCFVPETPILMSDFVYKPLGDVQIGDEVIGVQRERDGGHLKYVKTYVLDKMSRKSSKTVKLTGSFGDVVCTPEHKFLYTKHREYWQNAASLLGHELQFLGHSPHNTDEFRRGWLAGYIDGDGNFHDFTGAYSFVSSGKTYLRFKVASKDEELVDTTITWADEFGFALRKVTHNAGYERRLYAAESTHSVENERFRSFLYERDVTPDYARGYLAGAYDAEGTPQSNEVRLSQKEGSRLHDLVIDYAKTLGFAVSEWKNAATGMFTIRVLDPLRFFVECPSVLVRKKVLDCSIRTSRQRIVIEEITPNGVTDVCNLTTLSGNFVVAGLVVHNCDSQYAWEGGEELSINEVVVRVRSFRKVGWVMITGGEPLMQLDALHEANLVAQLRYREYKVEIETNGSIDPPKDWFKLVDSWVVDVKCPSSGPSYGSFRRRWLTKLRKQDSLKFVVGTQEDLDFVRGFLNGAKLRPTILISPIAEVGSPLGNWNHEWLQEVAEFCKQTGTRMSLQLHKIVYGDKRGV